MNESNNKIESLLGSARPIETSASSAGVLFESGRVEGVRDQRSRQQHTLRLWQLATACSLLIACGSILTAWLPPAEPNFAESTEELKPESETEKPAPAAPRETPPMNLRDGRLARMFSSPWGQSAVVQRDLILDGGIEGLPAIQSPGVSADSTVDNRVLINKLLAEERW